MGAARGMLLAARGQAPGGWPAELEEERLGPAGEAALWRDCARLLRMVLGREGVETFEE